MEVGLDGPERSTGLAGDLVEAQLAEEPQRDDLAVRLGERRRRRARTSVARSARRASDDGSVMRPRPSSDAWSIAADRSGRVVRRRSRPNGSRHATDRPLAGLAQGDPDRDARQPRPERAVAAPAGERAIGGHECLLGGILGLVEVAEDPVAGPDDRRRLALDEAAEGVAVAGEDGLDRGAVAGEVDRPVGRHGPGTR